MIDIDDYNEGGIIKRKKSSLIILSYIICIIFSFISGLVLNDHVRANWEPEIELNTDIGSEIQIFSWIAVENDEVHVVWNGDDDGDQDVYYRYFNGTQWQPEQIISSDIGTEIQGRASIAVENGRLYVVWMDEDNGEYDIIYRHFDGISWQPEQEISSDLGIENQSKPVIAVEDDKIHVVWEDYGDGDYDIIYRNFNGTNWQPEMQISTDIWTENQTNPSIAVENNEVHVVWSNNNNISSDIYYRYYDGNIWQSEQMISTDKETERQSTPSVAVENGKVYVVWSESEDLTGVGEDIYYRYFDGISWQPEGIINTSIYHSELPVVAMENGKIYVIWITQFGGGDFDIFYKFFNGIEWGRAQEISIDSTNERQDHPSIAVERGVVHAVWEDRGDGDSDIIYRRFLPADLEVTFDDLFLDPQGPVLNGTTIIINATIHNIGWANATNVTIRFYDGDPGYPFGSGPSVQIGTDQIVPSILVGENITVQITWNASPPGLRNIFVVADAPDIIPEYNESNNIANRTIMVGVMLHEGWNLISIPLVQPDTYLDEVLAPISGSFDAVQWYDITEPVDNWKHNHIQKPSLINDLTEINHTMGFWIHITEPGGVMFVYPGNPLSDNQSLPLHIGWNLVGYPSLTSHNRTNGLNNILYGPDVDAIQWYDASSKSWHFMGPDDFFLPGRGYWVHSKVETSWDVPL